MQVTCKICNNIFRNAHSFAYHLKKHNLTKKQYYDQFVKQAKEGLCSICNNVTSFRGNRYLKYCSIECYNLDNETSVQRSLINRGRKQPVAVVSKRVKNTNQEIKEQHRKLTLLDKYGVDNYSKLACAKLSISKKLSGRKRPRKDGQHQRNIIESKRRNGTLKHADLTKQKISNSLKNAFSDPNFDKSVFVHKKVHSNKTGYYKNIFYRSSYELLFLEFCDTYNVEVISAENNRFATVYAADKDGRYHTYYPDFYLPEYNAVIEVKAVWNYENNLDKFDAALKKFNNFMVVTEEELHEKGALYEQICSCR